MKLLQVTLAVLLVSTALQSTLVAARPNILLILADDLGWSDLGCYGGEIKTPTLDALAGNGLRFTQFYNTARCCPTRASLLTGLYPHQAGVGSMSSDRGPEFPGYRGTLQKNCVTLAEVLRQGGYHTSMVGKWHLHNKQDVKPTDRGFDEFYGMLGGYNSCWEEKPFYTRWPIDRNSRSYTSSTNGTPGTFYSTDAFADYSADFLELARREKKPFFHYLAFNAPHFPLHAHESDIVKYEALYFEKGWDVIREERLAKQKALGLVPQNLDLTPRSTVPAKSHAKPSAFAGKDNPAWAELPEDRRRDLARRMAVYAAMVDRLDAAVGRIIADLKAHAELENTLIIFLSDNGACWEWDPYGFDESSSPKNILHTGVELKKLGQPGDYMSYGSGWANAGNTPWRLYKHFSHEGGIRTPMIVHWPAGVADKGTLRAQVGHIIDIMATVVDVAQVSYPTENHGVKIQPMEGRSLLPALKNEAIQRAEPVFFEHERSRAVRDGNWKLVSLQDDVWELYDLASDPTEMKNLIGKEPAKAQELIGKWNAWAARCHVDTGEEKQALESPKVAKLPIAIKCTVETTAENGVILAHGGKENGYALHLAGGKVVFTVRIQGVPVSISSAETHAGKFAVEAELRRDGVMRLKIDGREAVQGKAAGLLPVQPKDGLSIGADEQTAVGDYAPPNKLQGAVKQVKISTAEE